MTNDVAVFLDLDNLVIGAKQANLTFDINLVLEHIKKITNGRIVLRRSYGDWRQSREQLKEITSAGFTTHSTVPLNSFNKNLADMQIVVDTMETLVDGHEYNTYVLITGDRDFTPLVHSLRRRGKQVIGVGVEHTVSRSFVNLCDHYVFYEELVPTPKLTEAQIEELLNRALNDLLKDETRVRSSILKQYMIDLSKGAFANSHYADSSFSKFLAQYPHLVELHQEDTTTYVQRPQKQSIVKPLHLIYRSMLKKQKLRVVPPSERFVVIKDIITLLQQNQDMKWRELIDRLAQLYEANNRENMSKNVINAVMLLARRAQIIRTLKGKSLSTAPVLLELKSDKPFQEAVIRCDVVYLQEILGLPEAFDLEEAAIALYDSPGHARYLRTVMKHLDKLDRV